MTNMALQLQVILDAELAAGNYIAEVSAWPPKCSLLVILGRKFRTKPILTADVTLHEINDPHYWKAEYRYLGGVQSLACKFD